MSLDWRVLLFTAGLVLGVSLFFGSVPAWQAIRTQAADVLRDAGRGLTITGLTRRLQNGLLVMQVALAMVLVTGAAFLTVSFSRLIAVDPGFDPVGAQTFRVPLLRSATPEEASRFHEDVIAQLRQLPGVERAGAATSLPLRGWLYGTTHRCRKSKCSINSGLTCDMPGISWHVRPRLPWSRVYPSRSASAWR